MRQIVLAQELGIRISTACSKRTCFVRAPVTKVQVKVFGRNLISRVPVVARLGSKKQRSNGSLRCSRLVPSPRYFAKRLLQSRQSCTTGSRSHAGWTRVEIADHAVRIRAEAAYTALTN